MAWISIKEYFFGIHLPIKWLMIKAVRSKDLHSYLWADAILNRKVSLRWGFYSLPNLKSCENSAAVDKIYDKKFFSIVEDSFICPVIREKKNSKVEFNWDERRPIKRDIQTDINSEISPDYKETYHVWYINYTPLFPCIKPLIVGAFRNSLKKVAIPMQDLR